MVHERCVKETGEVLELRVSGLVQHGNLVMFDKESDSKWLQETGRAIAGEKKGMSLTVLAADEWERETRWDEWKKKHPDSKVLSCGHCEDQ